MTLNHPPSSLIGGRYSFLCLFAGALITYLPVCQEKEYICLYKSLLAFEVICLFHFLIYTYDFLMISYLAVSRHNEKIED